MRTASAQRRERERENLRRAILDAARELFVTENYQAVSMRRIAQKIEYSPTAIYLYFKDKEEIFLHLCEEGFALLSEKMEALDTSDTLECLRQAGRVYLQFAFEQPHYYRIMFEIGEKKMTEMPDDATSMGQRTFGFIRQRVAEAVEKGLFSAEHDVCVMSHAIWAAVHGAASLTLAGRLAMLPPEAHEAFYNTVLDMTIRGFRQTS